MILLYDNHYDNNNNYGWVGKPTISNIHDNRDSTS
jgi:hypothetical protein